MYCYQCNKIVTPVMKLFGRATDVPSFHTTYHCPHCGCWLVLGVKHGSGYGV